VEAQACGTPVVATRVGGLVTAVRDGVTGLLVDGHHPADWAKALGELLDDGARRRAMQAAAVRHAAAFGWDATVADTLEVYAAAMREHRHRNTESLLELPEPIAVGALAVAP